ncbi:MAG: 16S rRNA (adenine(1518)-N(6)/adenine(1519)-N(6))-dimethyltransferase RsmA [Gammaproteobacteria bacterium]|nr:16S rRNA (adenine(1518)-N(6)/adenine(1519)-N(6))-dimethyltransferase RsmA [Gammaproteobacteria bacterium]
MTDFLRPRKRFGQHFLHDRSIIERIVNALNPRPGETIVEIGPGRGALTLPLLERAGTLHAVELDRDLAARLPALTAGQGQLVLHQADALTFNFANLAQTQPLRIIGNLPYNISTPLLFHLLDHASAITDMVFMLQKEVADRMVAAPDMEDYGRLSVMIQWRCQVEHLFDVGPGAFTPPPKVDSSIVRLRPRPAADIQQTHPENFYRVVKAAFAQRRKTLRNCLRGLIDDAGFAAAGIDPVRRAETLSLAEFARLTAQIKTNSM